jgi:hypothetical protein
MREREQAMNDERFESLERRMDAVEQWQRDAVPNADPHGHRRYHELMIEDISARKALRKTIVEKSVAGLVWGTLVFIAVASWNYIKALVRVS